MTRSRIVLASGLVVLVLLSGLGFILADGVAYLREDPAACANCHVMEAIYDGWQRGPHASQATCSDCHTPDDVWAKYRSKASSGLRHAFAYATGWYTEPITIRPDSLEVTEARCLGCHTDFVLSPATVHPGGDMLACALCHPTAGHP